ncbi:MAG: hypothetical protein HPY79_02440 [Bacteroidales bacterium]|nr:hypothetical protein [Bacteroidales bacterium]
MEIIAPQEGNELPLNFLAIKRLERSDLEIVEIVLNENQVIDLHRLSCKVIFYVKNGEGIFLSENAQKKVDKGTIIVVEPDELRGWACEQGKNIELLVVKVMRLGL